MDEEISDPPPLDLLDQPPVDRYCDVVLTGGVTDGVVYPWAVLELARKYRFKNIGGTSVGAMAAALTAAAEFGRRNNSLIGFNEVLRKLPRALGEDVNGTTRLLSLFQPAASTRRLFDLFVELCESDADASRKSASGRSSNPPPAADNGRGICRRVSVTMARCGAGSKTRKLKALLCAYRAPAVVGVIAGLLIGVGGWWLRHSGSAVALGEEILLSALPWAIVLALGFIGIAIYRDLVSSFVKNGFGLCTGYRNESAPPEQLSLVEWLHEGIQGAANKPLDRPLTFKDLWEAPGGPGGRPLPPTRQTNKSRSIDLRMVTTNLTHGRPYDLPPDDETSRLYYREDDLRPYFPHAILQHLKRHSIEYVCRAPGSDPVPSDETKGLRELPAGELPIVVAARLSLSFPVLFSAVPLWAIDYEPPLENRKLHRCWFSDGGICSNFPIHLFDSAVPQWPTFGIALMPRSLFWKDEPIYLPMQYNQGRGDRWDRFGDKILPVTGERVPPGTRLLGFLFSIIWSAKDWKDKTSMRMPGVRDRVIRVDLRPGEGGLNLRLASEKILQLANEYGLAAGKELVRKFIDPEGKYPPYKYWNEHRWVRFNSLLVGLRERIEAISAAAELAGYTTPLSVQIAQAVQTPPLSETDKTKEQCLTPAQVRDLQNLLAALKQLESRFAQAELPQPYTPLPTPSMRIRPPL